jgi:hypothetical protein
MLAAVAEDVTLDALGIRLDDEELEALRTDCIPMARRIAQAGKKIVGLLPASRDIGLVAVGVQLGLALTEVSSATVGYADANIRWPAISQIAVGTRPGENESMFATRWLRGHLALLTPARIGDAGAGVPELARVIQHGAELFAHLLVDLTGFTELGEHLAAIDMMDGVVGVARAGRTREIELLRLDHELPRALHFGVVLVGARPRRSA